MKLGLALAGGGLRGVAHIGVLKALEDNNIKVDVIGGTSIGSMVASLHAMGYKPYYMYVLVRKYAKEIININAGPIINGIGSYVLNKKIGMTGLNNGEALERMYDELAERKGIKKIADIKMRIVIPTVDIKDNKEYIITNADIKEKDKNKGYITDISVGKAIRASSCFPGVFCPCEFDYHMFLDGGILNNLPVREAKKLGADKILAVNFQADEIDNETRVMDILMRSIDIMGNKISEEDLAQSDFVLSVPTDKAGLFDVDKIEKCYKLGYDAVINNLDKIKELIGE